MIDKELLDILACPSCKADVKLEGDRIVCSKCARRYPIKDKLRKIYEVIHQYQYQKTLMLKSFLISFVSQMLFFTSLGVVALSIGSRIPIKDLLIKMPIVSMMSLLPSINGLGLREGSTVVLFGPLIGPDKAFAMSILWLLILLCLSIIGGLIYTFSPQFKIKIKDIGEGAI